MRWPAKRRFRSFRQSKRLTQRELALALGITERMVKYIEQGARIPSIKTEQAFDALIERHTRERKP